MCIYLGRLARAECEWPNCWRRDFTRICIEILAVGLLVGLPSLSPRVHFAQNRARMPQSDAVHCLRRGTSRVLSCTSERVVFRFAEGALLVTESSEYRGYRDEPKARHALTPGTEVVWIWPEDADEFAARLRTRECDDSRMVSLAVDGHDIGDLEWGKPRNGHEAGYAIASTIQRCRDAGLDVVVDGMPAMCVLRPASRKRRASNEATQTKSSRTSTEPAACSEQRASVGSEAASKEVGMPAPPTQCAVRKPGCEAGVAAPAAGPTPVTRPALSRLRPQRPLPESSPFVPMNLSASPLSLGRRQR